MTLDNNQFTAPTTDPETLSFELGQVAQLEDDTKLFFERSGKTYAKSRDDEAEWLRTLATEWKIRATRARSKRELRSRGAKIAGAPEAEAKCPTCGDSLPCAKAKCTIERLPVINDPAVSEALAALDEPYEPADAPTTEPEKCQRCNKPRCADQHDPTTISGHLFQTTTDSGEASDDS